MAMYNFFSYLFIHSNLGKQIDSYIYIKYLFCSRLGKITKIKEYIHPEKTKTLNANWIQSKCAQMCFKQANNNNNNNNRRISVRFKPLDLPAFLPLLQCTLIYASFYYIWCF
jgi:hypothetical protein